MASKTVDEYPDCARCPNRIFNTGRYIQGGRGSIHGDIVFLFPRGDRAYCDDYQLFTDIGNLYDEYSGRNNTEDVYMTYSVKCACSNNYSPLIKFKDDNLYHVFKQRFADDINWVNENRNNYGINFIND